MSEPRARLILLLGLLSFVIYAATAVRIHPTQDYAFIPERASLAAAVSNAVYGARLGKVYGGVQRHAFAMTGSTEQWLAEARQKKTERGDLLPTIQDGNGIGYVLVSSVAFRLFGTHIASVVFMMILLLGLSAVAFLCRFPDRRSVVVILYFTSLTVLLFTPLTWDEANVAQIPVGGIRYFSLLAILPAFHLILEFFDPRRIERRVRDLAPLAIQAAMLVTAVLVRNAAGPLLAAVALCALLSLWRTRRDPAAASRTRRKAAYGALAGVALVGLLMLSAPKYMLEGRFTETFWHRVIISFGLNPAFPFGNLREVYDCTKHVPEGLGSGLLDRNGGCIWHVHADQHGLSPNEIMDIYGPRYDRAMRAAVFDIARSYPGETFETFTVFKARYIESALRYIVRFDFVPIPAELVWLLAAALGNLLACALIRWPAAPSGGYASLALVTAVLAVFTIPPYILVWALPHSIADLLCLLLMGAGLALFAANEGLRRILGLVSSETVRAGPVAPISPDTAAK